MKEIIEIGTSYTLSEIEQEIVRTIAKRRFQNNRDKNVKNSKIGGQSDEFTDLEGFGAEMSFCKLFNVYPDFSIHVRSSKQDKGDAILHVINGIVDVKSTAQTNG